MTRARGNRRGKVSLRVGLPGKPLAVVKRIPRKVRDGLVRLFSLTNRPSSVAILGGRQVGKTTILYALREGKMPAEGRTSVEPPPRGQFTLRVKGKERTFEVPRDLQAVSGMDYTEWKKAFLRADHVWYLFRADLIAQGDPSEIESVSFHIGRFKGWLTANGSKRPRITLVGTWADLDPVFLQDPSKFKQIVSKANPIKVGTVKLNNAGLVVGSLRSGSDTRNLINRLANTI